MSLAAPTWFSQAVSTPFSTHTIDVDDCNIVYQRWAASSDKPALLLVHGNGAHAGWWDFIAPNFLDRFQVAALNLSGMGDSGHRERYTSDLFVKEVIAVSDAAGFNEPLLLGHSFGGRLSFHVMKSHPDKIAGVIMADSPFHNDNHLKRFHTRRRETKPNKHYPNLEEALARFRLSPIQPPAADFIMDYIGRRSIKQEDKGWTWKFDPKVWAEFDYLGFLSVMPEAGDNVLAMIYGAHSVLYEMGNLDFNRQIFADLGLPELICIDNAYHHLLLDQPLEFMAICNRLLDNYLAKQGS